MRSFLQALPHVERAGGIHYWTNSEITIDPRVDEVLLAGSVECADGVQVLKNARRRRIFRISGRFGVAGSIVLKSFPLANPLARLRYRKYGLVEFLNYQAAGKLGIPTAQAHAYFEQRACGFVRNCGLILEDLGEWKTLEDLLKTKTAARLEILLHAIPLLREMFATGVNHIDITPRNMLLSPSASEVRVIDWQYATFVAPRRIEQLLLQSSHFLNHADLAAHSPEATAWLEELHSACNAPMPFSCFKEAVSVLQSRKQRYRARLALRPNPPMSQAGGRQNPAGQFQVG